MYELPFNVFLGNTLGGHYPKNAILSALFLVLFNKLSHTFLVLPVNFSGVLNNSFSNKLYSSCY
ncbi:MAG: hypothetical protein L0H55_14355, partial [Candidatus Nitrosocosmicus sp.]|nr:hypothetical protein [Candidatus Nitrosocosmicus sp.]